MDNIRRKRTSLGVQQSISEVLIHVESCMFLYSVIFRGILYLMIILKDTIQRLQSYTLRDDLGKVLVGIHATYG